MRILHVLWSLDPQCGGPVEAIRQLVRAQVDHCSHEVSVLATTTQVEGSPVEARQFHDNVRSDPMLAGAEVHLAKAYGRRRPLRHYAYCPAGRRWLRARLHDAAKRPDLIHIHGTWVHLLSSAAAMARRAGIPYALRPAGALGGVTLAHGYRWLKRLYLHFGLANDLRRAGFVHVTSQREAADLSSMVAPGSIAVIPHGVEMPPAELAPLAVPVYERCPTLEGKRVLLFLGRLHPIKRIPLLVEAIARLRGRYPDLTLLLVGQDDGALEEVNSTARRLGVEDALVFAGFLQGDDKIGAFAAADVAALVSSHENFGISAVEAMAHGLPILVTPEVASHVYVDESGGGLTVEGTPDAVAGGIANILDGRPQAMGRAGQNYVRAHLTWEATAQRLDQLYRKMITEGNGQS